MNVHKRGKNVAIAGAALQSVFALTLLLLWRWTDSYAALACTFFLAGGIGLWLMSAMLLYSRQLVAAEEEEIAEIQSGGGAQGRIFETEAQLRPMARRMAFIEKWGVALFTILFAGYQFGIMFFLAWYMRGWTAKPMPNAAEATLFAVLTAFLGFLLGRYAIGMSERPEWRPLRAPASFLLVGVLYTAAVAVVLLAGYRQYTVLDKYVIWILTVQFLVDGVELVLNLILDMYRPRLPGQEYRPSFDSRLLNLVSEPGRVGHSFAEAMNYQFGFEVSRTWFFRLVAKSILPLIVFAILVLFAMSGIVLVHDGETAIVQHWGKVDPGTSERPAGVSFKLPWPVDTAEMYPTASLQEIQLGVGRERRVPGEPDIALWAKEHGSREEKDFLIAVPPRPGQAVRGSDNPPPVNVIKLVMSVLYDIRDPLLYASRFEKPDKMVECLANREMTQYCASATLDQAAGGDSNRPEAIMTTGRLKAMVELKKRIQAACDDQKLGVSIRDVLITSAHPPAGAATAFEDVLKAELRQDEMRYKAEAEADKILAKVAGDEAAALRMALAIRQMSEYSELQRLSGNRDAFARKLLECIATLTHDVSSLNEEIAREKLLGRFREGPGSKVELRQALEAYEKELNAAQAEFQAGKTPDFTTKVAQARETADKLLEEASGQPATLVATAEGSRWTRELTERARAEAFQRELLAYEAAPEMYLLDRWLDVWDENLPNLTKYVLGVDRNKVQLWLNAEKEPTGVERSAFATEESSGGGSK